MAVDSQAIEKLATHFENKSHRDQREGPRQQVLQWLRSQPLENRKREALEALWPQSIEMEQAQKSLDRLAQMFALMDFRAEQLLAVCYGTAHSETAVDASWLQETDVAPWMRNHLQLIYGRWLIHQGLYDESLMWLESLQPDDVVDGATLLFYQAIAHYKLLNLQKGQRALTDLLGQQSRLPRRYRQLGQLMTNDLKELNVDSLDHIARRMDDIERRLHLGRTGTKVRQVQDGVIASLDKLIKNMEAEQKNRQPSSAGTANQSSQGARESRILAGRGAGKVDKKNIGTKTGWGNLPPREREKALQQIGREFPSHYREAVEQYFKKLAAEEP